MKKSLGLAVLFFFLFTGASAYDPFQKLEPVQGFRPDVNYEYTWSDKLKRAGTNLWSAPLEIKYSMLNADRRKNKSRLMAVLEGSGRTILRWGAGWLELITAPFNFPDEFKGPVYLPARVWERETNPDGLDEKADEWPESASLLDPPKREA